jgi:hypothetical protein
MKGSKELLTSSMHDADDVVNDIESLAILAGGSPKAA